MTEPLATEATFDFPRRLRDRARYFTNKGYVPPESDLCWKAADEIERLHGLLERLRIEYDEVRFSRKHTKESPQHGDDVTLCGRDCEGRQ